MEVCSSLPDTKKCVQGTNAQRALASTLHTIAGMGHRPRQRGSQTHKQGQLTRIQEQGTRNNARQGYVLTEGMPWKHPGMVPGQARPRSPRPWLQIVCARAIVERLRLLKVVEDGPHGRTRMSSRKSFDNAMWHCEKLPRMYQPAMPAPWATPGAVPSFFASSAWKVLW